MGATRPGESPPQISVIQEGEVYRYIFKPSLPQQAGLELGRRLHAVLSSDQKWAQHLKLGFVSAQQAYADSNDGASRCASLILPIDMPRELVEKIFAALNESGLVSFEISSEDYPQQNKKIPIVLGPGENFAARVVANARGKIVKAGYAVLDKNGEEIQFIDENPGTEDSFGALAALQNSMSRKFHILRKEI